MSVSRGHPKTAANIPIVAELPRVPVMLVPSPSIDGPDAILDAVDAQFIAAQPDNRSFAKMSGVRRCVVPTSPSLIQNPCVPEDGY